MTNRSLVESRERDLWARRQPCLRRTFDALEDREEQAGRGVERVVRDQPGVGDLFAQHLEQTVRDRELLADAVFATDRGKRAPNALSEHARERERRALLVEVAEDAPQLLDGRQVRGERAGDRLVVEAGGELAPDADGHAARLWADATSAHCRRTLRVPRTRFISTASKPLETLTRCPYACSP